MGNYEQLKTAVEQVIKQNGNEEITGLVLQNTLKTIISTFGANKQFAGVATPSTTPGTPDANVFYLAAQPGVYPNFGGFNLLFGQLVVLKNTEIGWEHDIVLDNFKPIGLVEDGSSDAVSGGEVYNSVKELFYNSSPNFNTDNLRAVKDFKIYEPKQDEKFAIEYLRRGYNGRIYVTIASSLGSSYYISPIDFNNSPWSEEPTPFGYKTYNLCRLSDLSKKNIGYITINFNQLGAGVSGINNSNLSFDDKDLFVNSVADDYGYKNYAINSLFNQDAYSYNDPILHSIIDFKVWFNPLDLEFNLQYLGNNFNGRVYISITNTRNSIELVPVDFNGSSWKEMAALTGIHKFELAYSTLPNSPVGYIIVDFSRVRGGTRINENGVDRAERSLFVNDYNQPKSYEYGKVYYDSVIDADKKQDDVNKQNLKMFESLGFEPKWYGVKFDESLSLTTCERIGDLDLHNELPIQSKLRRCVTNKSRQIVYYLDANNSLLKEDGTLANLDGSDGDVMVEVPAFYFKSEKIGTEVHLKISEYAIDGYNFSPKFYVSAFEALLNNKNDTLNSVVKCTYKNVVGQYTSPGNDTIEANVNGVTIDEYSDDIENWRGGSNSYPDNDNDSFLSKLARPASNYSRANLRKFIANKGEEYSMYLYDYHKALYILMLVEFADRNLQNTVVGVGVGNMNYNVFSTGNQGLPIVPVGTTLSLGNNSGSVFYVIENCPEDYDNGTKTYIGAVDKAVPVPSYRGIENIYGHCLKVTDQLTILMHSVNGVPDDEANANGGIGNIQAWYAKNPYKTTDDDKTGGKMNYITNLSSTLYYVRDIKTLLWGDNADILPTETVTNTGSNTYYADVLEVHFGSTISDTETFNVIQPTWGGRAGSGNFIGMLFLYLYQTALQGRQSNVTRLCHR